MSTSMRRGQLVAVSALFALVGASWCQPQPGQEKSLLEFKTVEQAVTTKIVKGKMAVPPQPAYLGIQEASADGDHLVATAVAADSPAERAGLKLGDQCVKRNAT